MDQVLPICFECGEDIRQDEKSYTITANGDAQFNIFFCQQHNPHKVKKSAKKYNRSINGRRSKRFKDFASKRNKKESKVTKVS